MRAVRSSALRFDFGETQLGDARAPSASSKLFLQTFPNLGLFFSKLFQRFLWRFCGISRGCKPSEPKVSLAKFFAPRWARRAGRARSSQSGGLKGHQSTLAQIVLSRKKIPRRPSRGELRSSRLAPADAPFHFDGLGRRVRRLRALRRWRRFADVGQHSTGDAANPHPRFLRLDYRRAIAARVCLLFSRG